LVQEQRSVGLEGHYPNEMHILNAMGEFFGSLRLAFLIDILYDTDYRGNADPSADKNK
jgi:hypothetical protein